MNFVNLTDAIPCHIGGRVYAFYTIILILTCIVSTNAQRHDANWVMGYMPGVIDDPIFEADTINSFGTFRVKFQHTIDYSQASPKDSFKGSNNNTSISSFGGELQAYTDGCTIRDQSGEIINKTEYLNPGTTADYYCFDPRSGASDYYPMNRKSTIFLPWPLNDSKAALLHESDGNGFQEPGGLGVWTLHYTEIQTNANDSLSIENFHDTLYHSLHPDSSLAYSFIFTQRAIGGSGEDWWVFHPLRNSSQEKGTPILRWRLDPSGFSSADTVYLPVLNDSSIKVDSSFSRQYTGLNNAIFSPNGKYFALTGAKHELAVYHFDASNGTFTAPLGSYRSRINNPDSLATPGSIAFSASSRYLYYGQTWDLFQLDLDSPLSYNKPQGNLAGLAERIGTNVSLVDTPYYSFGYSIIQAMQLAPDCRIYGSVNSTSRFLSTLSYPDRKGIASQSRFDGIALPTYSFSVPYFPNYRMPDAFPCDSTMVLSDRFDFADSYVSDVEDVAPQVAADVATLAVYPNPAVKSFQVTYELWLAPPRLRLIDALGRIIKDYGVAGLPRERHSLQGVMPGLYTLEAMTDEMRTTTPLMVVE